MSAKLCDLAVYPTELSTVTERDEVTIGDMHGNSLKFIYFLIKSGVMTLEHGESDYKTLYDIYTSQEREFVDRTDPNLFNNGEEKTYNCRNGACQGGELTKEQLERYREILSKAHFNPVAKVRLIGDELCDRGNNDLLTTPIFDALKTNGVPYTINTSNHGLLAINAFLKLKRTPVNPGITTCLIRTQENSLVSALASLGIEIEDRHNYYPDTKPQMPPIQSVDEFLKSLENSYYPALKLIDYSFDDQGEVCLFTHALCDLSLIKEAVNHLNRTLGLTLCFNDKTPLQLAKTIDAINEVVINEVVINKLLKGSLDDIYDSINPDDSPNPITKIMWAREFSDSANFTTSTEKKVTSIHGHVGQGFTNLQQQGEKVSFNLDTNLGRNDKKTPDKGKYLVHKREVSTLTRQCQKYNELRAKLKQQNHDSAQLNNFEEQFYDENSAEKDREQLLDDMLYLSLGISEEHKEDFKTLENKFREALNVLNTQDLQHNFPSVKSAKDLLAQAWQHRDNNDNFAQYSGSPNTDSYMQRTKKLTKSLVCLKEAFEHPQNLKKQNALIDAANSWTAPKKKTHASSSLKAALFGAALSIVGLALISVSIAAFVHTAGLSSIGVKTGFFMMVAGFGTLSAGAGTYKLSQSSFFSSSATAQSKKTINEALTKAHQALTRPQNS